MFIPISGPTPGTHLKWTSTFERRMVVCGFKNRHKKKKGMWLKETILLCL